MKTWKEYNDSLFSEAEASGEYTKIVYQPTNGYVLFKPSSVFPNDSSVKISDRKPKLTDVVFVQYVGWLYNNRTGKKVVFDSSKKAKFPVNGLITGWTALLLDMTEGDEREVCIPSDMGYGVYGSYPKIPGYTTLFFNVKLKSIK